MQNCRTNKSVQKTKSRQMKNNSGRTNKFWGKRNNNIKKKMEWNR